ncbi:hypothetical protein B0H14DRAFT_3135681 [Mycena olivaceomarginata]|nr:hypothetical protein B0H14DRAFT_3135681 [Mycena olivaceomarginata]
MTIQAEVHKCKSEYSEAWKIHTKLVQILADQNSYLHALALLNFAELGVLIGVPQHDVRWNIDHARGMFTSRGRKSATVYCDTILADLYLREQDLLEAKTLFEKSLKLASEDGQVQSFCFEELGNASQWGADYSMFQWTTMFLVYSVKCKQPLNVHKALQFLGDTFLQKDEDTAIALLTVALEGFTYMDVHRSRAECMLRLGDISKSHGDMLKAVELWTTAQLLFERSSQVKQVQCVDERLAGIGSDVLEQQKENIAHLVELNVPSGNPCDIQDEEQSSIITAARPWMPTFFSVLGLPSAFFVTGLKFYEFFRTGHRSREPYTNTSNKSQNRQKMAQKIEFPPPRCLLAIKRRHSVSTQDKLFSTCQEDQSAAKMS